MERPTHRGDRAKNEKEATLSLRQSGSDAELDSESASEWGSGEG